MTKIYILMFGILGIVPLMVQLAAPASSLELHPIEYTNYSEGHKLVGLSPF